MHHLCIAVSMGREKKKERKWKGFHIWTLWGEGRGDILMCIYELHYMTAHTGPWEKTLLQIPGKNGALSRDEGSEGKRKARISTVFKVTKSSGVPLHSQRGFLSSLQVTLHHWEQNHPADSLLWSPVRHHAFALDNSKSQADLYKELSAHILMHLVFLLFFSKHNLSGGWLQKSWSALKQLQMLFIACCSICEHCASVVGFKLHPIEGG